jgi:hypothetical protein
MSRTIVFALYIVLNMASYAAELGFLPRLLKQSRKIKICRSNAVMSWDPSSVLVLFVSKYCCEILAGRSLSL